MENEDLIIKIFTVILILAAIGLANLLNFLFLIFSSLF